MAAVGTPRLQMFAGLELLTLLLSHLCCGALVKPIVDPYIAAVWGKNVTLKCTIDMNETMIQISWEKLHGKSAETIVVYHPEYGFSVQREYHGRVSFKTSSFSDITIVLNNVSFSDAGKYICKVVTFPLGNAESLTTVTVIAEPTVSFTKEPTPLIDSQNWTVVAMCIAATGKPAANISWEGDFGKMKLNYISFPNRTVTVISQYKIIPTKFATGRRITCIVKHPALDREIRYSHILDIQYAPEVSITGYNKNWFVGQKNVQLKCNTNSNPPPVKFTWARLDGQWPEGLLSVNSALHFNSPLTHNHGGTYICRVTNSLGQSSDQKTVHVLDLSTITTTQSSTVPRYPLTDNIASLASALTLTAMPESNWGTIIGSVTGAAFFLIFVSILVGVICYGRRRTFRGSYVIEDHTPSTDVEEESQVDVSQSTV
ncbi:nectin-3-like [Alligator mississippiensis]|uniref:nectin-3-like n=1 Tax=Alligator mississippiensis TaxID=8496 RepID=UPI00287751EC|nr:nectin-3-like [Alligator mississippiensis]